MIKPKQRRRKYFLSAFLLASFIGGKPPEFGQENAFFHGYLIKNPVIRVALCVNLDEVTLGSSSGVEVYEAGRGYRFLAGDVDEIRIKGEKEKLTERFYLQVAGASTEAKADGLAAGLKTSLGPAVRVSVVRDKDADRSYQVRVGEFLTRGEALRYIKTLRAAGVEEAWILRDEVTHERAHSVSVMVGDRKETLDPGTVIYFIPSHAQSYLSYNGSRYRGIFVLRATKKGLALINVLNLEDYLKGVVPEELSPEVFKAYEALKAQAVAARTYAIKHLGRFADLGFDVYDTPQSQVYGGLSAERPLSSRAVEETRGEVALYRGKLIDALYTSTCGGLTEDASNVFDGNPEPYLKSTECIYEKQTEWTLAGPESLPIMARNRNIDREVTWLISLGILPKGPSPEFYQEPVTPEEAVGWVRNAAVFLGKPADGLVAPDGPVSYSNLASLLVRAFQWGDRVKNLMLKSEVDFLMRDLPRFKGEVRDNLAYLIHTGILTASADLADESRAVPRGELALALWRSVRSYLDPAHKGVFLRMVADGLEVEEGDEVRVLHRSPDCFLFRSRAGEATRASSLSLLGGEKLIWFERQGVVGVLEVEGVDEGNVLDRDSPFHSWQVRQTREELENRIREYYPIGGLVDLDVTSRGKSRRVIGLEITGTESQVVVRGLKVRWVLGLRDTLFAIDREFGSDGAVTHFVFSGRGWGHGVGMCQVGAYRMAQAGASYRDILKKYYRDIRISQYN